MDNNPFHIFDTEFIAPSVRDLTAAGVVILIAVAAALWADIGIYTHALEELI